MKIDLETVPIEAGKVWLGPKARFEPARYFGVFGRSPLPSLSAFRSTINGES
jgi:hypothetical protein